MALKKLNSVEANKVKNILNDPILWAQAFLNTYNASSKKVTPWIGRWYQVRMMRDRSVRKVYRCGRRIGKTETMVVEMLWQVFTRKNFRVLIAAPYENQIRNMFTRLNELIKESPLVKAQVLSSTKSPYKIELANGSCILGFTTGDDASSIRGQRADWIYIDEIDFMSEYCFEVVSAIAIERDEIGITVSSTPVGKRSHFYKMCTDKSMGYSQHFHPSTHNPSWGPKMEAELRAQLTEQGYVHEVLAEFGVEEAGVFPKNKLDEAMTFENYAYNELSFEDRIAIERGEKDAPIVNIYSKENKPKQNLFRCMGVDWDKYGASSSLLILDYDVIIQKFKVICRVEVPRGEYSYDNAVNKIVELNKIFNPSYIYCDAGAGEYQVERLHIIGDENPHTGLKNKVKRINFASKLEVIDPITGENNKEPLKPFMINQLVLSFERSRIIMSPFDKTLHSQLGAYVVERISESGKPVFTSENEHFVDALGLAHLAFVQEFKELTNTIKDFEVTTKMSFSAINLSQKGISRMYQEISNSFNKNKTSLSQSTYKDQDDRPLIKTSLTSKRGGFVNWGSRFDKGGGRTMW